METGTLSEFECQGIRATVEARVLTRLRDAGHATPTDVLGPITIALMRFRSPLLVFNRAADGSALEGVPALDRSALVDLFPLRRLTLAEALKRAEELPVAARSALVTVCTELLLATHKQRMLIALREGALTGAQAPAAAAELDVEIRSDVLGKRLSTVLRARGGRLAPVMQGLIVPVYRQISDYYDGTPHITRSELSAVDPSDARLRTRAHYPSELLRDIADLVTGHWGQVLGRVGPGDVKSCLQRHLRAGKAPGLGP